MNFCKNLIVVASILVLGACSAPKQVAYFQDLQQGGNELTVANPAEIRIRPTDKLSIRVNSQNPKLTAQFTLSASTGSSGSSEVLDYTVDSDGCIDFPVLGKIRIEGKTREELAAYIKKELQSRDLVTDPIVTVEFVNLYVSIIGEVNSPGRYTIDKDRLTLPEALSLAGDLTIQGKRENVLVLRNENGKQQPYRVNLCSANNLYASPVYYLQQDDVVYVEPNSMKVRQSTVNGNTVRSTSFWLSLASFLTSIIVLIVR